MSLVRKLVALLALLMLSGCATTQLTAPKLTVVDVSMISADIFSQQFRLRLHVVNPNSRELPIKGIEYELFLQGDIFAEGVSNQPFVVPAMGEAEFETILSTNFMSSIGRLLSKLNKSDGNKVHYAFVGKVLLSKGFLRKIPFSEQGMVELGIKK